MSVIVEEDFKRWTAKRKAALVMDIIQGETSVSEASVILPLVKECRTKNFLVIDV